MYALVELAQICQFWRAALINNPQAWATIFASLDDRRSFVEICLERSGSAPLEVTMDVCDGYKPHPLCTCNKDKRSRITPNEINPCEWHWVYESFAETRHSKRIRTLNIRLVDNLPDTERAMLALGYCRFFNLPPLELVTLDWNNLRATYADHLFSIPPFPLPCAPCLSKDPGRVDYPTSTTSSPSPCAVALKRLVPKPSENSW